jgi:hypothetical protein
MMKGLITAAMLGSCLSAAAQTAGQVDLSCMSHMVRGKTPLTDRYKEYDVIVQNRCPGPVYWKMCIERLDPVSHKVVEVHTPAGYIEAEKKARVNVQMKPGPESMAFRKRYQSFYVDVGYAVNNAAVPTCIASTCEASKAPIHRQIDQNLAAWARAEAALEQRLAAECPETGWGRTEEVETCEAAIREASMEELEQLAAADAALREELQAAGPDYCVIEGGDLIGD